MPNNIAFQQFVTNSQQASGAFDDMSGFNDSFPAPPLDEGDGGGVPFLGTGISVQQRANSAVSDFAMGGCRGEFVDCD